MAIPHLSQVSISTPAGTPPLVVTSSDLVSNLNAQYLNGQLGGYYQNAGNLNVGTLLAARLPAFTGDVSSTVGTVGLTLASVGTAGTYRSVTTDAKGRVTAGTNPTTLAGYGITDAIDISGAAQTKSGNLTVSSALTSGGNFYAATTVQYSNRQQIYTVNYGGAQDLAWKKIADVIVPSGLYRGITFKIDVVDNQGNFGWNSNCFTLTYFASCIRSGGVQDDYNNANVTGPVADYVRVVKTATGVYELQIRQLADWQTYIFTAEATINSGGCTVTYASTTPANGSTSGTIYNATATAAAGWTSKLANIAVAGVSSFAGQITSTIATGTAPLVIASTTLVSNLNAQYLNGQLGSYYAAASSLASYLPLAGGTLTGELVVNYAAGRQRILDGANALILGHWDTVNVRIEASGRPLYMVSYGGAISIGRSSGSNLVVDTASVSYGGNTVLHAGNVATYAFAKSGAWAADLVSSYGYTRETGMQMSGGSEFVVLSKSGQGYLLVDGSYIAAEAGGFYSTNNSSGATLLGFTADTTTSLNFNTTAVKLNGNQVLHAGNYNSYALPLSGGTLASTNDQILTLNKSSGTGWGYIGFSQAGTRRFYFGLNASFEPELGVDNGGTFRVVGGMTVGGNAVLTSTSTLTAGNLSGTIPSGVLGNSTHYVGTTAITLNRALASQTLTGVSIDGNAATATNVAWSGITSKPTTFGGFGITDLVYGSTGSRNVWTITDWNQGTYPNAHFLSSESSTANAPSSDYTYGLQTSFHRSGSAYRTQMVTELYSSSSIWVRNSRDSDVWTAWSKLLHSNNYSSYALPLSGGTLTGGLSGTTGTFSGTLTASGNVGIGTTGPSAKLHVYNGSSHFEATSNGNAAITAGVYALVIGPLSNRDATAGRYYGGVAFNHLLNYNGNSAYNGAPQAWIGTRLQDTAGSERDYLVFATKSGTGTSGTGSDIPQERMCIDYNGFVGIGTLTPGAKLHVYSSAAVDTFLESGTSGTTGKLIFKTSDNADLNKYIMQDSYYMVLNGHANEGFKFRDSNGNVLLSIFGAQNAYASRVGIGTITPAYKLDVSGTGRFSDTLQATRINFGADNAQPWTVGAGGTAGAGLTFGGDYTSSQAYKIFTAMEDVGGNYSKLTLNWHTGIRIGAYYAYGGTRFYNNLVGEGTEIFSVGNGDSNVRVVNTLYIGGNTALHAGNFATYALPLNPDGDGVCVAYSDENPTFNGVGVGGGWYFGADGSTTGGGLTAKILNAFGGGVNSTNGYYVGNNNFLANSSTTTTTLCIDGSNNHFANELTISGVGMGAYNLMKYSGLRSGDWQTFTNTEGQLNVIQVNNISSGAHTNYPTGVYGYGAVMSWRTTNHSFQLYAAHTGDLAYKTQWGNDNYSGWRRILDSTNYPYAAAMNQNVGTSNSPSFTGLSVINTITGAVSGSSGSCTGNAATATSATYLNSSNYINRCGTSGNANTDFTNTPAGSVRHNGDDANLTNSPGGAWWFYDNYRHSNGSSSWGTQVAWGWDDNANRLATRNVSSGSFGSWVYYLNSVNYNSYVLAASGSAASLSIGGSSGSCTGNAATATSSPLLSALANYVWDASTLPNSFNLGIQSSFVQGANGWPSYGSVVTTRTYGGGGGSLQMYVPYSPSYGGTGMQVRFGNYDVSSGNSWTAWKTLLASDNYGGYSTFSGIVSSASGGFQTATYVAGRNRIWSFGNADTYGINYYQGAGGISGNDVIGLNFGNATAALAQFQFLASGSLNATGTITATNFSGPGTSLTGTASSLVAGSANAIADGVVSTSAKIAASVVTYAKIQNVTAYTVLGNSSASGTQAPVEISMATLAGMVGSQYTTNIANSYPDRVFMSTDANIKYAPLATAKAHLGLSSKYNNSRPAHTGDTNYWVGSMGWGATDWNAVFDYGSGFTDSWGSVANNPGDTSHHVGVQALHYTNGSSRYGWQMVNGAATGRWWLRDVWGGGFSSWKEVIHSGNIASQTVAVAGSCTGSAGSVAWTNVSGRPTAVSSFSNDSGYITSGGSISGSSGSCTGNAASVTDGVYLSTNQSIGGVKTFSSAPVATNIAKAWVHYNKSTTTITASYNVSSVTSNGTGVFTVNFTNAMVDTNYVVTGTATYGYDDQDIYGMALIVPRRSTAQQAGSCRLATEFLHAAQVYDCVAVRAVFYR